MHVGVKITVSEGLGEEDLHAVVRELPHVHAGGLEAATSEGMP
jgi:hypothetical protein